jgi:CRISPR-associated protein Cas5t
MQLYLECPCTSFPRSFARDFKETYRYPPPSTVYGMLLSLVGEVDMLAHIGIKLAIGTIGEDRPISRIIRKQRHHKFANGGTTYGEGIYPSSKFSKPNHHELLTDLRFVVRIDSTLEAATVKLTERVAIALSTPEQISRFGGLSLGESWAMLNGIRVYRKDDGSIRWLTQDKRGLIGLPVWINRETTQGTFARFTFVDDFIEDCWVSINPPEPPQKATKAKSTRKAKE